MRAAGNPSSSESFQGAPPPDAGVFQRAEWTSLLIPEAVPLSAEVLAALSLAAPGGTERTLVVAGSSEVFEKQPAFEVDWDPSYLNAVASDSELGHIDTVLFDSSEAWGVFVSPAGFAVVGAREEIARRFIDALGGAVAVRQRFLDAIDDGEIGFGTKGKAFADQLLNTVGWRRTG